MSFMKPSQDGWSDMTAWLAWLGGECPVGFDDLVDVRFDDGSQMTDCAGNFDWEILGLGVADIAFYRLTPADSPLIEPEIGDWFKILPAVRSLDHLASHIGEKAATFIARCFRAHIPNEFVSMPDAHIFDVVLRCIRGGEVEVFVHFNDGHPRVRFGFDTASMPVVTETVH
jgi:hypothetical protein